MENLDENIHKKEQKISIKSEGHKTTIKKAQTFPQALSSLKWSYKTSNFDQFLVLKDPGNSIF
ncbi:hypothetical protein EDB95_3798 [Dinghuibacter silviterrae]|uniref:Uncharacterized protein n=1 Tax=Dinghuibacter silviterrae TaxID=1539049 RepID=A0A4R8DEZ3_9BACT|nr:hypothetical protein EDB95_3798 [Dinghuibacter silviterrae]